MLGRCCENAPFPCEQVAGGGAVVKARSVASVKPAQSAFLKLKKDFRGGGRGGVAPNHSPMAMPMGRWSELSLGKGSQTASTARCAFVKARSVEVGGAFLGRRMGLSPFRPCQ